MLTANELRVGNYLKDEFGNFYPVLEILEKEIVYDRIQTYNEIVLPNGYHTDMAEVVERTYGIPFSRLQGIPLTPELLEKCSIKLPYDILPGLQLSANYYRDASGRYDGFRVSSRAYYVDDKPQRINISLYYVHQLQNLVFTLTGNELTINL